jgi:hypothetical protein
MGLMGTGEVSMNQVDEYLRRNLQHARSTGVCADISAIITRVEKRKTSPRWLVLKLFEVLRKAQPLPHELANHRDEIKLS